MKQFRQKSSGSLVASIAIHVVLVVALFQIVFRYPLGQLMGLREVQPEPIRYVNVMPRATENSGVRTAHGGGSPAPLTAPTTTTTTVPVPDVTGREQAAGGTGDGRASYGSGIATGVVPSLPDPRIRLEPGPLAPPPRTTAQDVDSIVTAVIGIYLDSVQIASTQRNPGDWTVRDSTGRAWGWDREWVDYPDRISTAPTRSINGGHRTWDMGHRPVPKDPCPMSDVPCPKFDYCLHLPPRLRPSRYRLGASGARRTSARDSARVA